MSTSIGIDLSQLPPPAIIEELDVETILENIKEDLKEIDPDFSIDDLLESDPVMKILEVLAYRELYLRQRINEAARGTMLATARAEDLDNLAALFGVERRQLDPGDPDATPPIPATWEEDEALRRRTQRALGGFSSAGPEAAYVFYAQSAQYEDEAGIENVKDVSVRSDDLGEVQIAILSDQGDGEPSPGLKTAVEIALNDETVRPITDKVIIDETEIVHYSVEAKLTVYPGPDAETVRQLSEIAVQAYVREHHRLSDDITLPTLYAAIYQEGVQDIELIEPKELIDPEDDEDNLKININQAAYCSSDLNDGDIKITIKEEEDKV